MARDVDLEVPVGPRGARLEELVARLQGRVLAVGLGVGLVD